MYRESAGGSVRAGEDGQEPVNMGGWPTMALKLPRVLNREVGVVSLPASSAPASGSARLHATTHREIIETAIPSA